MLNLPADTPRERLTFAQVAVGFNLNKPTCLDILTSLTDEGFVTRDETKRYGLANVDLVRPYFIELHDRGVSCILPSVHSDHSVILDQLSLGSSGERRDLIGERFPFAPPLDLGNTAWDTTAATSPGSRAHLWHRCSRR
jgi:hypothetical protein